MKLDVSIAGRRHVVELRRSDAGTDVELDGRPLPVEVTDLPGGDRSLLLGGRSFRVRASRDRESWRVRVGAHEIAATVAEHGRLAETRRGGASDGPQSVTSVMPGKVVRVLVEPGQLVDDDQGLVVVEAMKMENEIVAPRAGRVRAVHVSPGQPVESGVALVEIE